MTIQTHELVEAFGDAADRHVAALFVGAGLSIQAGHPSWDQLMRPLTDELGLTDGHDLTLAAEYFEHAPSGGRARLEGHLATELSRIQTPAEGHRLAMQLGVQEVWTTNFDPLLELADTSVSVVNIEDDAPTVASGHRVVIKLHGGFDLTKGEPSWRGKPVISRGDFERYDIEHPRLWALLQASYLTRTMLFLGFSFTDPNIELLLRLARRQGTTRNNHHLAVLKRPVEAGIAEHRLRVKDLESNGVSVCEIDSFDELPVLLQSIKRRSRPPRLFVSGSGKSEQIRPWCEHIGAVIARHEAWEIASLAGDAGWWTTQQTGRLRQEAGTYLPEQLKLYFRRKADAPAPPLTARIGTTVFSTHDRHPLVDEVIDSCRAMVVIGGGRRTAEEVALARDAGVGVVPIAASGGAAQATWAESGAGTRPTAQLGGRAIDPSIWSQLANTDGYIVAQAAEALLKQAMYAS